MYLATGVAKATRVSMGGSIKQNHDAKKSTAQRIAEYINGGPKEAQIKLAIMISIERTWNYARTLRGIRTERL